LTQLILKQLELMLSPLIEDLWGGESVVFGRKWETYERCIRTWWNSCRHRL